MIICHHTGFIIEATGSNGMLRAYSDFLSWLLQRGRPQAVISSWAGRQSLTSRS